MMVDTYNISFLELSDVRESAKVLSIAMLNNPTHIAVLKGNGETQRLAIERIFLELFQSLPAIIFVAKELGKIVGVIRMKSCSGQSTADDLDAHGDENDIHYRTAIWFKEWARRDPPEQHWHLGPIGVLPSHTRQGIGTRFMELFCQEVDKCSAKAFLETDSEENVLFYEKFGFKVVSRSNIFEVENTFMMRAPVI